MKISEIEKELGLDKKEPDIFRVYVKREDGKLEVYELKKFFVLDKIL